MVKHVNQIVKRMQAAREVLQRARSANAELPVAWLRLAAAQALDAPSHSTAANDLAHFAVLELASRAELDQVIDLANRFGVEAMGGSGFVLQYVRGIIKYQQARTAHGGDQPTFDAEKSKPYEEASAALKAAIVESDAEKFPVPAATCRRLIAWCAYFQGQFLSAKESFVQAASALDPHDAPEALWMAIVCLDKLVQADANPKLRAEQARCVDEFLTKYPSNEHAAKLVLRRALASDDVSQKAVNDLLSIPPGSDSYASAQRRAADLLYQLFRESTGPQRASYGRQYLNVAQGLIDDAAWAAYEEKQARAAAFERLLEGARVRLEELPEELRERLEKVLREQTGLRIGVAVLEPGAVPRSQGKAVRVVDRR